MQPALGPAAGIVFATGMGACSRHWGLQPALGPAAGIVLAAGMVPRTSTSWSKSGSEAVNFACFWLR